MLHLNQIYSLTTLERCLCIYLTWFDWLPQHSFIVLRQNVLLFIAQPDLELVATFLL